MKKNLYKNFEIKNNRLYLDGEKTRYKERTFEDFVEEYRNGGNECAYLCGKLAFRKNGEKTLIYLWGDEETFEEFFSINLVKSV